MKFSIPFVCGIVGIASLLGACGSGSGSSASISKAKSVVDATLQTASISDTNTAISSLSSVAVDTQTQTSPTVTETQPETNTTATQTHTQTSTTITQTQTESIPTAPTVSNSTLTFSSLSTNSLAIIWAPATDGITPQGQLQYQVYISTRSNLETLSDITTYGTALDELAVGSTTQTVTDLSSYVTYYFNVVVTNLAGLQTHYTMNYMTTDQTVPTVATNTLTFSSVASTRLVLSWAPASDQVTPQIALQYQVYTSTTSNIDTLDHVLANGTALSALSAGVTTQTVTNLTANTTYYFNVVVTDGASYSSAYAMNHQTTGNAIYLFSGGASYGNMGGRDGADLLCSNKKTNSYSSLSCTYIHALLNVTESDYISNYPTQYGSGNGNFPTSAPVVSPGGYALSSTFSVLTSGSWGPCSESNTCNNGGLAGLASLVGGTSQSQNIWVGAQGNCSGWNSNSGFTGSGGTYYEAPDPCIEDPFDPMCPAFQMLTNTRFLSAFSGGGCSNVLDVLCVCW